MSSALYPSSTTYPGATTYPDPPDHTILRASYTMDAVWDPAPAWHDASTLVRSFNLSRGRENELADADAGTAQIVLDNRDRTFDPIYLFGIKPMNRWRLEAEVQGVVYPLFFGYAEAYELGWEDGAGTGGDALSTVSCVDEMKVLALDALPTTDPPRNTYTELVAFDQPSGYWPMDDPSAGLQQRGLGGGGAFGGAAMSSTVGPGAIVGEETGAYTSLLSPYQLTIALNAGDPGDVGGLPEFTLEGHFNLSVALPTALWRIVEGPLSSASDTYTLSMTTTGLFVGTARNASGTLHTVTSLTAAAADQVFHHVVLTITGGSLRLYVDGVQEASTAWTGLVGVMDGGGSLTLGTATGTGTGQIGIDELAIYRIGLAADRVTAHYTAATERGYPRLQDPGDRIEAVLDSINSTTPRAIRTGTRQMVGRYMAGQPPLQEIRAAETAENVDAVFFIAKDGTITFLDDGHRSVSPWDTVQATFDDDGTDLPYLDVKLDSSESFLHNEINVTRTGGTTTTETDSASILEFFKRPLALTDLPIVSSTEQDAIAAALLAKYKDPMTRIVGLSLDTAVPEVAAAALALEIGDRIRVFRTPPGGGPRIDQTLFVQKITVSGQNDGGPWRINLSVTPL